MNAQSETYQGWKNYPTWAVNLWLSNDEPLYREALEMAAEEIRIAPQDENVAGGIWTTFEAERYRLADAFKTWVRDVLAPDLGATFAADLLGYALDEVDWHEIATSWIEQVRES